MMKSLDVYTLLAAWDKSIVEKTITELAQQDAPAQWDEWLYELFPEIFNREIGFAEHHEEFWQWVESIDENSHVDPFVAVWARGGAKTTSAECAVVRLGAKGVRKFVLYVRGTQDKANETVSNIAALLEANKIERYYPHLGNRMLGKYGQSKGWRANMLRCANGFSVVGIGLDAAVRGIKIEGDRPDLIIFDDIDDREDTEATVNKKIRTITRRILPAGSGNVAVAVVQNLIHPNSIVSKLVNGKVDFLVNRIISGPHPAIKDLQYKSVAENGIIKYKIIGGIPTWKGQNKEICQKQIDTFGIRSFLLESQHEIEEIEGALWTMETIDRDRVSECPPLKRIFVGVDPSVTNNKDSDETGIIIAGQGINNHFYTIDDVSLHGTPHEWATAVIDAYRKYKADRVVGEANNGGDLVELNIKAVDKNIDFKKVHASRGKLIRAEPIATLYSQGKVHHVGAFPALEKQMCTYVPGQKSPDRLDALVWALTELSSGGGWTWG